MRGWARAGRRTTVLGQYPAGISAVDCGFGEDRLNAALGDLPLTLICCCRRDLDTELLSVARRTHPHLATTAGRTENPEYRTPSTACPTPAGLWGAVASRVGVDGTGDLAELRRCVADVAERAGLEGDAARGGAGGPRPRSSPSSATALAVRVSPWRSGPVRAARCSPR